MPLPMQMYIDTHVYRQIKKGSPAVVSGNLVVIRSVTKSLFRCDIFVNFKLVGDEAPLQNLPFDLPLTISKSQTAA